MNCEIGHRLRVLYDRQMMTINDTKDGDMQSSMSWILPPVPGDGVPTYLSAAVRALGGRSDADFARTIGVKPHIIANWRRRRAVPDEWVGWFGSTFVEKVGTYNVELPKVSLEARTAVVALIARTRGDPIGAGRSASIAAGLGLGGLLALAQFLMDVGADCETEPLVDAMMPLMLMFRHADQLRTFLS